MPDSGRGSFQELLLRIAESLSTVRSTPDGAACLEWEDLIAVNDDVALIRERLAEAEKLINIVKSWSSDPASVMQLDQALALLVPSPHPAQEKPE